MCHAQLIAQRQFRRPLSRRRPTNGPPLLVTARALPSGNTSEVDIFEFSIFDRTPCWHLLLPLLLVGSRLQDPPLSRSSTTSRPHQAGHIGMSAEKGRTPRLDRKDDDL